MKMKTKIKKIIALAVLCGISGANVYASAEASSVTVNTDYIQNEINISYSSELLYNTAVTFVLTRADAANSPENYLRIAEADYVPGKNTECKISFGDDINCRTGHEHCEAYKVYAVPGGLKSNEFSAVSPDFVICCSEKQADLIMDVNTKPEAEALENIKTILTTYFGIDVSGADSGLGAYFRQIQADDYNGNYSTIGELPDAWNAANALLKVNSAADCDSLKNIVTDNSEILKVNTNDTFFKMDTEGVYSSLFDAISANNAYSLKSFTDKMNDSIAVSAFCKACESELDSLDAVFEKFSKNLGISDSDMEEYRKLKKENKYFASNFSRQFDKYSETLPEKIGKYFSNFISEFNKDNNKEYSSNSGGGTKVRGEKNALGSGTVNITAAPGIPDNRTKSSFTDVPESHWAHKYVTGLYNYGVISGYPDGSFRPDALITRGEFIKLITESRNVNGSGGQAAEFTDLTPENWVYPYVSCLASAGLISGYEDGSCGAARMISREEAAALIERVLKYKNVSFIDAAAGGFADENSIADYAKDAIKALNGAGIISGFEDGSFMPKENLTRAQAAVIIFKAASM